jgi:hypothetical protein
MHVTDGDIVGSILTSNTLPDGRNNIMLIANKLLLVIYTVKALVIEIWQMKVLGRDDYLANS